MQGLIQNQGVFDTDPTTAKVRARVVFVSHLRYKAWGLELI